MQKGAGCTKAMSTFGPLQHADKIYHPLRMTLRLTYTTSLEYDRLLLMEVLSPIRLIIPSPITR